MILPLVFFMSLSSHALDSGAEAIEHARELILKRSRHQACELLSTQIKITNSSAAKLKLISERTKMAQVFFSDRGQKYYEAGKGQLHSNTDLSLTNFDQAMALEDGNTLVAMGKMRVALLKDQCAKAKDAVLDALGLDPADTQLQLFELKILSCLHDDVQFEKQIKAMKPSSPQDQAYLDFLHGQNLFRLGKYRLSLEKFMRMMNQIPSFSEGYYWAIKAGVKLNRNIRPWAEKYLSLCGGLTDKERNLIPQEPLVCAGYKEIESELAKINIDR